MSPRLGGHRLPPSFPPGRAPAQTTPWNWGGFRRRFRPEPPLPGNGRRRQAPALSRGRSSPEAAPAKAENRTLPCRPICPQRRSIQPFRGCVPHAARGRLRTRVGDRGCGPATANLLSRRRPLRRTGVSAPIVRVAFSEAWTVYQSDGRDCHRGVRGPLPRPACPETERPGTGLPRLPMQCLI